MIAIKNILVGTDFSAPSEAALIYGRNFARAHSATLHVVHVSDDVAARVVTLTGPLPDVGRLQSELETESRRRLDEVLTDDDRRALHARAVVLTSATPAQTLLWYARDANIDLIIVGTHGRTGIAHFFMGSVAQHIVRSAPCPVLTVRHPEREFVVPDALQVTAH